MRTNRFGVAGSCCLDSKAAEVREHYEAGNTLGETGAKFGASVSTVSRFLKKIGCEIRPQALAIHAAHARGRCKSGPKSGRLDGIKDEVIAFYLAGHSMFDTGRKYGMTEAGVAVFLKRHGVPRRPRGESISLTLSRKEKPKADISAYGSAAKKGRKGKPPIDPAVAVALPGEETKHCRKCGRDVPLKGWYCRDGVPYSPYCRLCWAAYGKEKRDPAKEKARHEANWERNYARRKEHYHETKDAVLAAYGGKCECCGESAREFLAVDHKFGGGNQHRAELRKTGIGGGTGFYRWLISNGFPDSFRLLCHNCNQARGLYGYCPHERSRKSQ
jgi:hypothetical protein